MEKDIKNLFKKTGKIALTPEEKLQTRANLQVFLNEHPVRNLAQERLLWQRSMFQPIYLFIQKPMPAIIIAVLLLTGGVSYAAEQSLPGDTLYPVKVSVNEEVVEFLKPTLESKTAWDAKRAERRLEEAETLLTQGKFTPELRDTVEQKIEDHLTEVSLRLATLKTQNKIPQATQLSLEIESTLTAHETVLDSLTTGTPGLEVAVEKVPKEIQPLLTVLQEKKELNAEFRATLPPMPPMKDNEVLPRVIEKTEKIIIKLEENAPKAKDGNLTILPRASWLFGFSENVGKVGERITIYGKGFLPKGNAVLFGFGYIPDLSSPDGRTLTFEVPRYIAPRCAFERKPGRPICMVAAMQVSPGTYEVRVETLSGSVSNTLKFVVVDKDFIPLPKPAPEPEPKPIPEPTPIPRSEIEIKVSTDKQTYFIGERIQITVTASNPTDFPVTLKFATGCQAEYFISGLKFGTDKSLICAQATTEITLSPRGTYKWTFDHALDFGKTGSYELAGSVIGYGKSAPAKIYFVNSYRGYEPTP